MLENTHTPPMNTNSKESKTPMGELKMSKIFLTIVGKGVYQPTKYRLGDKVYENRFVQKSILKILSEKGEEFDKIIFFLTDEAKEVNWEKYIRTATDKNGEKIIIEDEGLKPFLEANFKGKYQDVQICFGDNEDELLEMFGTMYDAIGEEDEITFDITHGFRFIPFLFFPVMSYAKELKNVTIKSILYGLYKNGEESDIIELKKYDDILSCANAAHNFICSGNSAEIAELISRKRDEKTIDGKKELSGSDNVSQKLKKLTYALLTCQGGDCDDAIPKQLNKIKNSKHKITKGSAAETEIFNNIINHAIDSVDELNRSEDPYDLGLNAVKWYMERGLILQAYTALKECVTTFFCCKYAHNSNYLDRELRENVDRAINSLAVNKNERLTISGYMNKALEIFNDPKLSPDSSEKYAAAFVKIVKHIDPEKIEYYRNLRDSRNCMNHFGMRKSSMFVKMDDIGSHYKHTLELFADIENRTGEIITDEEALNMLKSYGKSGGAFVNFSNHPSEKWCKKQLMAARELSGNGQIEDIQFPVISADATEEEIDRTAKKCAEQIAEMNPSAVMCMGEFGLCFKVVELLHNKGIKTVYSCSERQATEIITETAVEKTSVFSFVKFRKYS